ncbi:aromatic-ring-hydroxylating dioxygenase subunit beta [Dasania marina]|uniref:aromatic-ring-hydroxylating dioxygenase subunit beta n=1 Tax=Dasania marina TaxID=471499 RepID=UPI0030DCA4DB|tara:strand:- start:71682 stop:72164 length:483 start_codon:yes stop_codon:yes gene_type:complete
MNIDSQLITEVTHFINQESDMLDYKEYADWLKLWSETGLYIVPVDHSNTDYKNSLNIAYDDAEMRVMRTDRLLSGEAVSTQYAEKTVRTLSRIRVVGEEDGLINVRCAYCLYEHKKGKIRSFPANVEFKLRRMDDSFLIEQKVINILLSDQHLKTVSYIF